MDLPDGWIRGLRHKRIPKQFGVESAVEGQVYADLWVGRRGILRQSDDERCTASGNAYGNLSPHQLDLLDHGIVRLLVPCSYFYFSLIPLI